ncbi:MAG: GTP-binding protein [Phycisphaerae bacterium]
MTPHDAQVARYIMVGGFLGAGKTTAVAQLARHLTAKGMRVGLISNDQSTGLVDTTMLRSQGFSVEEIAGGCFCCRFNSLLEAAEKLTARTKPDAFIAEPVGSCTDLIATVSYPLRRIYGHRFTTAPLSVLVDPARAARIFELAPGRSFSPKVVYVYRKQLEEADIIVVNKVDAVDENLRRKLVDALATTFDRANVVCCSAREGTGLAPWFDRLLKATPRSDPAMDLDYDRYADGEALLGWLNCSIRLSAKAPIDGNTLLVELAGRIGDRLRQDVLDVAHLKMTLEADPHQAGLGVVSVVSLDAAPDVRESLLDDVGAANLIVNLRAEGDPDLLRQVTLESVQACAQARPGLALTVEHMEHFRPAKPTPTHRVEAVV